MLRRLTLISRIALIIFVSLVIVWIVAIAAFYRDHTQEFKSAQPEPMRLASLVRLLDTMDATQRALLVGALSNKHVHFEIIPSGASMPPAIGRPVSDGFFKVLRKAMADHPLQISEQSRLPLPFTLPHKLRRFTESLEIRVGLRTGETLLIDFHAPLIFNRFGVPVGFSAGLIGTIIALIALVVTQHETKPLERLAEAVDRVDLSGTQVSVPEARRGAPEIRAVISAFNRLQGRLGNMLRSRMALVGGISHDVRTFATRLRLRIEAIPDPAERQRATKDIDDMIFLLDDALLSTRAGAGELVQEMIEIARFVQAEADDRHGGGAVVTCKYDDTVAHASILADRLALRRIIANLIDNAIKYGHAAHLAIGLRGQDVVLTVDDEGPGIPQDQRELMLEPFSRLETSRSRETGGAGLGLAVVRTLVEAQAGKIAIMAAPGGGARVEILFPLFQQ